MPARMSLDEARSIEREPVKIGNRYTFYSTMAGKTSGDVYPRRYTGQEVEVVERTTEVDEESSGLFLVRADDGVEFDAYPDELDGFIYDTGQFYTDNSKQAEGFNVS